MMNFNEIITFVLFLLFVLGVLFLDLGIFNKKSHELSLKEALTWTAIWVSFALVFYIFILNKAELIHGINNPEELKQITAKYHEALPINIHQHSLEFNDAIKVYRKNLALEFITGYIVEYSLSSDNVFVILLIFLSFGLAQKYYKRVLFWGILGAIILRFIFIFISSALIQSFACVLYLFGGFLFIAGIRMLFRKNKKSEIDTHNHPIVKLSSKLFNVFPRLVGQRFYIYKDKRFFFTPLMIILLVVEFSDVIFAVDSVPAVFAVTRDPFIVFFSNIFAIIGLRSLFFLIAKAMYQFRYLDKGISLILAFVGFKMIFSEWFEKLGFKTEHSLFIIIGILASSIIFSVVTNKPDELKPDS